jgi:hypothetical protein
MGRLWKCLPAHNENLGRSYMVATPQKDELKIRKVLRVTPTLISFDVLREVPYPGFRYTLLVPTLPRVHFSYLTHRYAYFFLR